MTRFVKALQNLTLGSGPCVDDPGFNSVEATYHTMCDLGLLRPLDDYEPKALQGIDSRDLSVVLNPKLDSAIAALREFDDWWRLPRDERTVERAEEAMRKCLDVLDANDELFARYADAIREKEK